MTADLTRRDLLGVALAAVGTAPAFGQAPSQSVEDWARAGPDLSGTPERPVVISSPPEPAGLLSKEVVELWPQGRVPGAAGVTARRLLLERGSPAKHDRAVMHVSRPTLEVFRPARPDGSAVIVLPGGAYVRLAIDKEGAGSARYLGPAGVTVFMLNYRLPMDGWEAGYDCALQDVQRAIRLVRANAARWRVDPARIGVMGFSAGGHLAAAALTRHDAKTYEPLDTADALSARPDMAVLGYAPTTLSAHNNGPRLGPEILRPLNERVAPGMAPTFIFQAADDPAVAVGNSLAMFSALQAAKVPAELHIYQEGAHGFGFSLPKEMPASRWPLDWQAWATRIGFLRR
jgi:acetyl esterase/lipase